jgi:mRNA interferase RelE/StbE
MYKIAFSEKARNCFKKFPSDLQKRIGYFLERIKIRPHSFVKRLIGTKYFRGRIGNYRIILDIQNKICVILVLEIGPRKNIYK